MPLQTQALWFPPDSNSQVLRQEEEPMIPLSELRKKGPRVHVLLETNHQSSFPKANYAGLDLVRWSDYCFIAGKFISMTNGELLHGPATHHELLTQHQSQENKVIWLFMHSDKLQKRHMNNMQCCHIKYLNIYSNRTGVPSQTTNQRSEPERLSGWCSVAINSSRNEPRNFHTGEGNTCKNTWSMWLEYWERLIGWRSDQTKISEALSVSAGYRRREQLWWFMYVCATALLSFWHSFVVPTTTFFVHPDPKLPLCVLCISHLVWHSMHSWGQPAHDTCRTQACVKNRNIYAIRCQMFVSSYWQSHCYHNIQQNKTELRCAGNLLINRTPTSARSTRNSEKAL